MLELNINDCGTVYDPDDIFCTSEAAKGEGRDAINTVYNKFWGASIFKPELIIKLITISK
ncbi:MAG: hypothetical protein AAGA16_13940 [Cyanobacteria bacterium P01_E01_bin.35]